VSHATLIRKLEALLAAADPEVLAVYLYGSRARGTARSGSDVGDGIIVLHRDRAARLRFEVQSRNEYFDLEPVRRLYRRGCPGDRPGARRQEAVRNRLDDLLAYVAGVRRSLGG
jgi:predicted nucleotidyltransferase